MKSFQFGENQVSYGASVYRRIVLRYQLPRYPDKRFTGLKAYDLLTSISFSTVQICRSLLVRFRITFNHRRRFWTTNRYTRSSSVSMAIELGKTGSIPSNLAQHGRTSRIEDVGISSPTARLLILQPCALNPSQPGDTASHPPTVLNPWPSAGGPGLITASRRRTQPVAVPRARPGSGA